MSEAPKADVFTRVTQRILDDLEKGVRPWVKPWNADNAAARVVRPVRHTGEPYNGINILLLWGASLENGFHNPTWMTFKQATDYGGHVRKGEKASLSVYANKITKTEVDEKTGEEFEREIPFMKGYSVFNVEQIEGLPEKFYAKPPPREEGGLIKTLDDVEAFINSTKALIRHGGGRAYYAEGADMIQLPPLESFTDAESYYATKLHELTHWTKHETRCDRDFGRIKWGDEGYAKEELVAEIGAAFLCADLGITPEIREDHAAYIGSWLKALKDDKKLIFKAAAHASRAVDFMKGLQPKPEPEPENGQTLTKQAATLKLTI